MDFGTHLLTTNYLHSPCAKYYNRKFTARLSTIFVDTLWCSNIDPALTWLVTDSCLYLLHY